MSGQEQAKTKTAATSIPEFNGGVAIPRNELELLAIMRSRSKFPTPIRPMGANSASTQCTTAVGGTVVDMAGLNRISDLTDQTVTCEAGVTLRELADYLAEHGMELAGALDLVNRTVGGAVASGCFGPSHDGSSAFIASQAIAMRVVTPEGTRLTVNESRENLMNAFRLSFGALGIIYQVTFRIRPQQKFVLKQRKMDVATFAKAVGVLGGQPIGIKFFYLPFKDRVYTELRRAQIDEKPVRNLPWKLKDMGETSVLPAICGKLGRIVPIAGLRYSLVDGLHDITQSMLTNTLTEGGSYAAEHVSQNSGKFNGPPLEYTTWCFPVDEIGMLLTAYRAFAADYYQMHKFRCDMPVVGFRLPQDRSALLSPCFEQPMFALRFVSNPHAMWEDYVMDLGDFAQRWGGVPLLNQSRCAEPAATNIAYGSRLEFFRKIRRQLDPDQRMLNSFLSQYLR
ncbi:MAG: FAD-binding oxidoreductase [Pseudomonadota bacterium]